MLGSVFGTDRSIKNYCKNESVTHQKNYRMNHRPEKPGHGTDVVMFQVAHYKALNKVAIGRKLSEKSKHQFIGYTGQISRFKGPRLPLFHLAGQIPAHFSLLRALNT